MTRGLLASFAAHAVCAAALCLVNVSRTHPVEPEPEAGVTLVLIPQREHVELSRPRPKEIERTFRMPSEDSIPEFPQTEFVNTPHEMPEPVPVQADREPIQLPQRMPFTIKKIETTDHHSEASSVSGQNPPPAYPGLARLRGWQGSVTLFVDVDAEGRVTGAIVAVSSGHACLDDAAVEAVNKWRFRPAIRNGRATASALRLTFEFKLEEHE